MMTETKPVMVGRFEIPLAHGIGEVRLPKGADIFAVSGYGSELHVFASVDPDRELEVRRLGIIQTNMLFDLNKVVEHVGAPLTCKGHVKGQNGDFLIFECNRVRARELKIRQEMEHASGVLQRRRHQQNALRSMFEWNVAGRESGE